MDRLIGDFGVLSVIGLVLMGVLSFNMAVVSQNYPILIKLFGESIHMKEN